MSVQFGRWSFNDVPAAPGYLDKAAEMLAPYGPDGGGRYSGPGVDILYRGFHTTRESRRERQPHQLPSGAVFTWDGRLDNRQELIGQMSGRVTLESPDVAVAAAAYEQWGTKAFGNLIGDWALSVWEPRERALLLAKDFLGARHLYYAADHEQVTWSTILDPLVLLAGKTFQLEEEYIAGWLAFFPAAHLTPYVGIHAVPPSTFVCLHAGKGTTTKYWDFDPHKQIRYASDSEYEEHFRTVFGESVRRRLRSDAPVLAELSGGMDSSSIVCMADRIIAQSIAETPRLDTVSYYDDSEPNWNERPYFTKVEEQRGKVGCHISIASQECFKFHFPYGRFSAAPGGISPASNAQRQFAACLVSGGNRVLLSGIGGDEFLGGVPTPTPELADLLARGRLKALAHRLKIWALCSRKPWFHLFLGVAREFSSPVFMRLKGQEPPYWLDANFAKRHRAALTGYKPRLKLFGPLPTFQENMDTLDILRRQLGCRPLSTEPPHAKRYPYLDRDLLEFAFAIPRGQLIQPGLRRSLMRRSVAGMVPDEILNRRRKAFVARAPIKAISGEAAILAEIGENITSNGIVSSRGFRRAIQAADNGETLLTVPLLRILSTEYWLRSVQSQETSIGMNGRASTLFRCLAPSVISAEKD